MGKKIRMSDLPVNYEDLWNLDVNLATYIEKHLIAFKKVSDSYPGRGEADTSEHWKEILDKMILAFHLITVDDWQEECIIDGKFNQELLDMKWSERHKIVQEGLHLFADWMEDLWI